MDETKSCSKCKEILPVSNFVRRKFDNGNWGYTSWCKNCRNIKSKKDWEVGDIRDYIYKKKFGISLAQYDQMLKNQNGKCAICNTSELTGHGAKNGRFSVDHDHKTGEVRGLLCHSCNIGIGCLKDDVEIMKSAIHYIQGHNDGFENKELIFETVKYATESIADMSSRIDSASLKIEYLKSRITALEG